MQKVLKIHALQKVDDYNNIIVFYSILISTQKQYYRLRYSAPQPLKLCRLPKPAAQSCYTPMRPIVVFCGSPTYQLFKYLSTILQLLTDKSRRKLQSTENFIDDIKTVKIADDYKLVWFWCEITVPSIARQLALHCTETAIQSTVKLALPGQKTSWTYWTLAFIHRLTFSTTVNTTNGCMEQDGGVGIFGFADLANFKFGWFLYLETADFLLF